MIDPRIPARYWMGMEYSMIQVYPVRNGKKRLMKALVRNMPQDLLLPGQKRISWEGK